MSDIEISDLIGFGYDLSDTQYGLTLSGHKYVAKSAYKNLTKDMV